MNYKRKEKQSEETIAEIEENNPNIQDLLGTNNEE